MGSLRTLRKRVLPPGPWDHMNSGTEIQRGKQDLLFEGCREGNLTLVQTQLDNGADVNEVRRSGTGKVETPLLAAINRHHSRVATLLLKRGADPNLGNCRGVLPVHCAAASGMIAVVKALVASGADVNAKTRAGDTPVSAAYVGFLGCRSYKRRNRVIEILTEAGARQ